MTAILRRRALTRRVRGSRRPGLAAVGLLLLALCMLTQDGFATSDNLTNIALASAPLLIAAMGTMVLLVAGHLDLSIGSQYALVSVATALVVQQTDNPGTAAVFAIALGTALGAVNGLLVVFLEISPLIVTLAMLAVYRGMAFVVSDGLSVAGLPDDFIELGQSSIGGVPVAVVIAIAVFALAWWWLASSRAGLRLLAIGGDTRTAVLAGVPVRRHLVGAFALNGTLIGLVALLGTAKLGSGSPVVGLQFEITVLTAVILGGVAFNGGQGHPLGVFAAVATLGVLDAGLIFAGLQEWNQQLARGALLLVALAADQVARRWERSHPTGKRAAPIVAADPSDDSLASLTPLAPVVVPPDLDRVHDLGRDDLPDEPDPEDLPILEIENLRVVFPGAVALDGVSLAVHAGELVCLVGDNGAGKSTLVRALAGAVKPGSGGIWLDGEPVRPSPRHAQAAGIETVHQRPALCPNLGTAENLALGHEPVHRFARSLDRTRLLEQARGQFAALGLVVSDPHRPVRRLSGGEQQLVAIARSLRSSARLVLLDEPTTALGVHQAQQVRAVARSLADSGRAVVLVTHDIEEVFAVADRVVVLQRGRVVFDGPIAETRRLELMRMMSGRAQAEAARTVEAVAHERKRIERAIHDGAQQNLVTASMVLQMATDRLRDAGVESEQLSTLLSSSEETLAAAIAELRDLSRGLHPGVLTSDGLEAAVEALVARRVDAVGLTVGELPRLPEAIEAAAYFVVSESLTNVSKHARAQHCEVNLGIVDNRLVVEVMDDGVGGVNEAAGSGVRGLRDQVSALGGEYDVGSWPGYGTRVRASIPIPPA